MMKSKNLSSESECKTVKTKTVVNIYLYTVYHHSHHSQVINRLRQLQGFICCQEFIMWCKRDKFWSNWTHYKVLTELTRSTLLFKLHDARIYTNWIILIIFFYASCIIISFANFSLTCHKVTLLLIPLLNHQKSSLSRFRNWTQKLMKQFLIVYTGHDLTLQNLQVIFENLKGIGNY